MANSMLVLVSDDQELVERTRNFANVYGLQMQVYSTHEWSHRDSATATTSTPSSSGHNPVEAGAKILQFPQGGVQGEDQRVKTINELEGIAIQKAIDEFNGNLTEAAKASGIGRATLYRKVKQYNIDPSLARKKRAA